MFKVDSVLYLNSKPHTIVDIDFNAEDWKIDKKPLEKLINDFNYLDLKQLEGDARKEEDNIPEMFRQGNLASRNLIEQEREISVTSGLRETINKTNDAIVIKSIRLYVTAGEGT